MKAFLLVPFCMLCLLCNAKSISDSTKKDSIVLYKQSFSKQFLTPVKSNYYYSSLGFFCKKELQIEKALKLPLRFRLGSYEYTKYLEKRRD